ncbi:flagellar protein FliS [Evansella caseinilytica]|uniref:Flagellar secretion chaperone FliS n=1 Tax=Evansella caseinilytica TaxID=1503961 RepID=A0A1H3S7S5_9BACI|nr:flagellar export chaperone FliS [Evansella caseinilytica]SDZ33807.1 flagellar protein FliS [Evansella caseinilytica]
MAVNNPYATYQQRATETKTPGELTLMLYEGCLKFIRRAEKAIDEGTVEEKNTNIIKAQNIIRELMVTLNTDVAVAQQMMQMYDFILNRLVDANVNNDKKLLKEAEEFVTEFRDTWKEVVKLDRQRRHGAGASSSTSPSAAGETRL